jgi:hypothetical protein
MSDYMEYYEFYKKHWERSLSEKTSDMQKEIETLRFENARFRDALEDIVHCIYSNEATLNYCEKKAREALKGDST